MKAQQWFLGFNALAWLPYGIFLIFYPSFLEGFAGLAATTAEGRTEIRAMYGGMQAAIGALAVYALVRPRVARGILTALAFLFTGLCGLRLLGTLLDGAAGQYTVMALTFEIIGTLWAWWTLHHTNRQPGATIATHP